MAKKLTIIDCEQQSDEWFAARLGRVTASRFSDVLMGPGKSGYKTYMMKLLAERMTGMPQETYSNKAMENGIETEPQARDYYVGLQAAGQIVKQIGFIQLGEDVGASPDGLVGSDGLIEIKCPFPSTHLIYILKNKFPPQYKAQVQGQLWVTDRKWCDFISFNPEVANRGGRPYWSIRVEHDEAYIENLKKAIEQFVYELKTLEEKVKSPF